jgi:hypothetical protein
VQPVIAEVPKPLADENFLDQQLDDFSGSIADPTGDEVGQKFGAPGGDRASPSIAVALLFSSPGAFCSRSRHHES